MTLTPAYGRDYKSRKAAAADFDAGKDFIVADMMDPYCGKPINRARCIELGLRDVAIRYQRLRRVTIVRV